MSTPSSAVHKVTTCHYEVLNVPRNADAALIKKAYRKLALFHHPDKNLQNPEQAQEQFRLVQQAYECLSDASERKWYDEHRDAILNGWSANNNNNNNDGNNNNDVSASLVVHLIPFLHAGCYNGYTDQEGDFFAVYRQVFQSIVQNEQQAWINQGHLDDLPWLQHTAGGAAAAAAAAAKVNFGKSDTEWNQVAAFYQTWQGFGSCWNFAWADEYVSQDGDDRRLRRAMDDINQKRRKAAKKEYHATVLALVQFCQRRDPRVQAHDRLVQAEKEQRLLQQQAQALRKRNETQQAREQWKVQAAKELAQAEVEDRLAGRVRLADLDDDYDYGGGKKKGGKKKKKKGKKNKQQQQQQQLEDEDDDLDLSNDNNGNSNSNVDQEGDTKEKDQDGATELEAATGESSPEAANHQAEEETSRSSLTESNDQATADSSNMEKAASEDDSNQDDSAAADDVKTESQQQASSEHGGGTDYNNSDDDSIEDDDDEDEVWRCECCRKDFKSEGQLENHVKSKKHKEALKKYQVKMKKMEQEIMNELLDELEIK